MFAHFEFNYWLYWRKCADNDNHKTYWRFFKQTTRWLIGNVLHLRRTDNNSTYLKCTHELCTQIEHIWCWFYCCRNAILPSEISYIQTSIEMLRMCLQCTGVDILAIYSSIRISKISYSNFKLPSLASEERKKNKITHSP